MVDKLILHLLKYCSQLAWLFYLISLSQTCLRPYSICLYIIIASPLRTCKTLATSQFGISKCLLHYYRNDYLPILSLLLMSHSSIHIPKILIKYINIYIELKWSKVIARLNNWEHLFYLLYFLWYFSWWNSHI